MAIRQDPLEALEVQRAAFLDARLAAFQTHLQRIIATVNGRLAGYLQKALGITNGVLDGGPGNLRILRGLGARINVELDRAGLQDLITAFVAEFPGQLHFIYEELRHLDVLLPGALPAVRFKADEFVALQTTAAAAIDATVEQVTIGVSARTMFVGGGLKFADLVESVSDRFQKVIPGTVSMGDLLMSAFYRTAYGRAAEIIQRAAPDETQEFKYFGVRDIKNRLKCAELLDADLPYTRKQIDLIDVPGFPMGSCFRFAMGFGCRHRWRLWFAGLNQDAVG